ncbi:MAG: DUF433 domain-containing protein [Chloroflexi bacterium]|nr:DUF433 domain-containing protein [Chloroflexota bacterium]
MKTIQKSLRVPQEVAEGIEGLADAAQRDFSSLTNELLEEALKMRRCPGIWFAEGPSGRRARIADTGLDVWEVIAAYKHMSSSWPRLRKAYDWLTQAQLRAALGYYAAYPDEIERALTRNVSWTKERLGKQHPSLRAMAE